MRTLPRLRWVLLVLFTAAAVLVGTLLTRASDDDVITFQYNHLSATMQASLEVDTDPSAGPRPTDPATRVPVEPTAAAAILAIAGLALALQQRDRNKRS